ncbi:MAG: hypothetical protein U0Q11_26450 [Vicinamibacterales bacterium]
MMILLPCGCMAVCGLTATAPDVLIVDIAEPCQSHEDDLNHARWRARMQIVHGHTPGD